MAAAWLRLARAECLGRARLRLWKGKEQAAARRGLSRPTEEQVKQRAFPVPQSQPFFRLFARQAQVRHQLVSQRKQAQLAALVLWAFQPLAAAQQKSLSPGDARALSLRGRLGGSNVGGRGVGLGKERHVGSGGRHTAGGLLLHDDDDAKIRFVCGARLAPLMGSGGRDITKGLGGWCGEVGGQGRRGSEGRTVIRTKQRRFLLGQLGQCKAAKLDEAALASWAWAGDAELGNCGPQMQELRPRARHHRPMAAP